MVDHAALGNSELHEPKGVASATDGTVYVADGLGSGSWEPVFEETSTSRAFSGASHDITGLGDYSAIIVTLPNLVLGSGTNQWLRYYVGNSGGFTTSSVYYNHHWDYSGVNSDQSFTYGTHMYSYTASPTVDQTYRLLFTNWNKEYYTVVAGHGYSFSSSPSYRPCCSFIREQKAYDRLRIWTASTYSNIKIQVQGFKG